MKEKERELLAKRGELHDLATALNASVETEDRSMNEEETAEFDGYLEEIKEIDQRLARMQMLEQQAQPVGYSAEPVRPDHRGAPAFIRKPGDNFNNAFLHYIRTGDTGGISHMMGEHDPVTGGQFVEVRASNDTTMNITTAADGGVGVPTTLYDSVIAKRDYFDVTTQVGCRRFSGKGTSKDVVYDNEDDGEFVSTSESGSFDRDAPAMAKVTLTKTKYTKKTDITQELSEDEDVGLMDFLVNFFARGMAKTRNDLLITEVETNGTNLKTFASATAIAAGEPEDMLGNVDLDPYLDESGTCWWVMRPSTLWDIRSITGNPRLYGEADANKTLLGYPVAKTAKADAIAATKKTVFLGNWYYMGYFEEPSFTMLRDPYSRAANGEVLLHMYFRIDYGQLQAEAIGYGTQAT